MTEEGIYSADKIITVSKRTEKDLDQYLGVDTAIITKNYIDVDEAHKERPSAAKIKKVLKKYKLNPRIHFCRRRDGGKEKHRRSYLCLSFSL